VSKIQRNFRKKRFFSNEFLMIFTQVPYLLDKLFFFNGTGRIQTRYRTVINWPPGSGSVIQDYGSTDTDL